METEEIVKLLIALVVLILMIGLIVFLLKGKGGALLDAVKNLLRFGR